VFDLEYSHTIIKDRKKDYQIGRKKVKDVKNPPKEITKLKGKINHKK